MKIENVSHILCDYGCNHEAQYLLNNGKYCCSASLNACEAIKQKNGKLKVVDKVCPYCNNLFKQINVRVFANHVRQCKKNPKHDESCGKEFKNKLSKTLIQNSIEKYGEYQEFTVKCDNPKCSNYLVTVEREKKFPEKEHYFCCSTCAHSYSASSQSEKSRQKISFTLKNKKHTISCLECGKDFEAKVCVSKARCPECKAKYQPKYSNKKYTNSNRQVSIQTTRYDHYKELDYFCGIAKNIDMSGKELSELRKKVYRIYRVMCSFSFSIKDYPDEFNFDLLKDVGMYSAKNRGNNQDGVSRDHMYSCAEGFKNNISPLIISHPANCQLITQRNNASKRHNSSITLDELMKRIDAWEQKYGKYEKKNVLTIPEELFKRIQDAKICHPENYDGYVLIYEKMTLKMKWWNAKDDPIPEGWQLEMPVELRLKHSHKKKQ